MLPRIDNVPNARPLRFGRVLPLQQLSETKNCIEWRAPLVADPREKFIFRFVGAFYFLNSLSMGDVFYASLIVENGSVRVADDTGVFAKPDLATILAVNLVLE